MITLLSRPLVQSAYSARVFDFRMNEPAIYRLRNSTSSTSQVQDMVEASQLKAHNGHSGRQV